MNAIKNKQLYELDKIAKMLVKRDLELSGVRADQEQQIYELDRTAKRLVRRDFDLLQANDTLRLLDEARAKNKALLDSIGDGVVATDSNGKVILINESATSMLGLRAAEVLNKDWFTLVSM